MDDFEALLQDRVQELVVELMSVVEVVRAPSQHGVQQLVVELIIAGSWATLHPA